jgi:flagellar assembly factor FliW
MNKAITTEKDLDIVTRFGMVSRACAQEILLEKGLVGFPDLKKFFLIKAFFKQYANFTLLQSAVESDISFILYGVEKQDVAKFFAQDLLDDIISEFEIKNDQLAIFLVANIKVIDNKQKIFVNNKAPILLNKENNAACQYIINDKNYEIRREISL